MAYRITCPQCRSEEAQRETPTADGYTFCWCAACGWEQDVDLASLLEAGELANRVPEATDKPTQAETLIGLADDGGVRLFHSPEGEPYGLLPVGDHLEVWGVESRTFKDWLRSRYYRETRTAPKAQALKDAVDTLAARAKFEGEEHEVHTRVAESHGCLYLDLCSDAWEAVEITRDGWRVVEAPPVRFRRRTSALQLPRPVRGGSLDELRPLVNLQDEHGFALFVSFVVAALRPRGPYPVLVLHGEQGSAKSTAARIARALVDPSQAPLRTFPCTERDLIVSASHAWVLAFDNLAGVKAWQSDALCRLATGGGFAARQLYTDSEEVVLEATRPVILNGIDEVVGRQDLVDRSLVVSLPTIPDSRRRQEKELWAEFERLRPRVLGALLDAVSCALRRLPEIQLEQSPRMADFAHWIVAAEPLLPWTEGTFLAAYESNRREAVEVALESDVVAAAILSLIEEAERFEGTSQQLLDLLAGRESDTTRRSRSWPKSPRALSSSIKRLAPGLRRAGIEVTQGIREGGTGRRLVRIVRSEASTDRHNRHDRHKPTPDGTSGRDDDAPLVTVADANRHDEDATPRGICDGCDGRDGSNLADSETSAKKDRVRV